MNKFNLLSRAEMKQALGGTTEPIWVIGGEGKDCSYAICAFPGPNGEWVSGWCGTSINGQQCRCIGVGASVPWEPCLP